MMSKDVKVEAQNQNIFAVAKIMSDNDIGSVIIIDNHENRNPVDIVTERDILRILDSLKTWFNADTYQRSYESPRCSIIDASYYLRCIDLDVRKKIRRIPIVDKNNNLVGIVTKRDIFKLLMKNKDLLSVISNENTNIAQKPIYNDFINFWFNETQPKR